MTTTSSLTPLLNTSLALQQSNAPGIVSTPSSSTGTSSAGSTQVTLTTQSANTASLTYTKPVSPLTAVTAWESSANDDLTSLMAKNFQSSTLADRFNDMGKTLLASLANGGGNDSQSVMNFQPGQTPDASLIQTSQQVLHTTANNQITLNVTTKSGATAELSLGSSDDGLAAQIKVTNGTLTDADRKALSSLADGFQQAIDGLSSSTPSLNLSGLTQFDPNVLSSVDLHASLQDSNGKTQTMEFHADAKQRSISAHMDSGTVNVSVDTSQLTQLGNAQQQTQAINAYLKQFDDALQRGHGDATLMSLMKQAFSDMVTTNGSANQPTNAGITLNDTGRSLLTGLPDFSASIKETPKSVNPMRPSEVDQFSYQVSQQTTIMGSEQADYSVTQLQESHLSASYHTTLSGSSDEPLGLKTDKNSQNYRYYQIDDSASSQSQFSYGNGELIMAMLTQSAQQNTHMIQYELGKVTKDVTTPAQASSSIDLLDTLKAANKLIDSDARQNALNQVSNEALLVANPSQIKASHN
ncbi:MAG TPA: hypothetical protein VL550_07280 [Rhodocyclaceae bacterium]|jgi:hypothetical protein|nr:hypothetical protein [Rhodocyclaceae bacterium]